MKRSYRILALLAAVMTLIVVVAASFWAFAQIARASNARKHTDLVVNRAKDLLSELIDAETGQRGFALTGDEAFLEPYFSVRDGITGHLEELRQLTSNSAARQYMDALVPLVAAQLAGMKHIIDLRRSHNVTSVIGVMRSGAGRKLMDSIRAEQKNFIRIEEAAAAQNEIEFQTTMRHLLIVTIATSLFMLLFVLALFYLIHREAESRLEHQVLLKTQHLLQVQGDTNEELKDLATELKRAARAKSEFLANMSHELRTPLNSIIGFSEVLYDETFGPLIERQKSYVQYVLTSGKHLLLLINQILDMSKIESGKMRLALTSVPMRALLHETSSLMAHQVSKKKLQMSLEIAEELPNIEADDLKVKEVIYNLLSNAINFTPEGGRIGMRAKQTASDIVIEVWDTGVGIAAEHRERIFEGFFRVDTPYSRLMEGTGLGLPFSRKMVELHGGELVVESEGSNKGTLVRVTLPILSKGA